MINAAVTNATPATERIEITLMKFFFRLERKYRLAMKRERFKGKALACGYSKAVKYVTLMTLIALIKQDA